MSELTTNDIKRIAHLARLQIEDIEAPDYLEKLSSVLHMIDAFQKIDTAGVEPMPYALSAKQLLRDDKVSQDNQRDLWQAIAPATESGLYLSPRVIE